MEDAVAMYGAGQGHGIENQHLTTVGPGSCPSGFPLTPVSRPNVLPLICAREEEKKVASAIIRIFGFLETQCASTC